MIVLVQFLALLIESMFFFTQSRSTAKAEPVRGASPKEKGGAERKRRERNGIFDFHTSIQERRFLYLTQEY